MAARELGIDEGMKAEMREDWKWDGRFYDRRENSNMGS